MSVDIFFHAQTVSALLSVLRFRITIMSLNEYSLLMKEAGLTPQNASGADSVTRVEVKLVHRLDEKWEKLCANVTAKLVDALLEPAQIVLYSLAASAIIWATGSLIRAIRAPSSSASKSDTRQ